MKMSLQANRLFTKPACIAGVRVSRPNRKRPVRSDEIVVAPQELDVPAELVCAPSVAGRATAQVRRALANREVERSTNEVFRGCGILRRPERVLQPTRRADLHAPLDPHDTNRFRRVGAAAENAAGPQAGTHLEGREQPQGATLAPDERAEFISLQLLDVEIVQHPLVEALSRCRGPLKPSRDSVAGMDCDPGSRRNAHALDSQACDLVELPAGAAKAAIRCARVRAQRPADCAGYRRRRPDFVTNEPWPTMSRPGFPRLSHPGLAHAISSVAFIAQV